MNDVRFSSAMHLLILVSEANEPMSSAQIAESLGANSSWVRRLASSLKNAGIVKSQPGRAGFELAKPADAITLLDIYCAACGQDTVHVFESHANPSDECIVGRHIRPVVSTLFANVDEAAMHVLRERTLADCITLLREDAERTGDVDAREGSLQWKQQY